MNIGRKILIFLSALLFPIMLQAQFYVTGDDPGKLKWNYMDTDNFRVIYPQGCDSLATEYGFKLEKYKVPVSRSTGYMVGQGDGRLMPVVMHTYNTSNGSVAWAPKRMDLFTIPTAYDPEPMPWSTMLSVHEGRHITQMQFGMTNAQRPFTYVFGEMWNILVSLLYPGLHFIEGDAVIAETAFTPSGRGRTADFLNYYRVAFDQGEYRRWDTWQFGSQKYYTPDHYALGYMTLSGMRYLQDYPDIMKDGYARASRKLFDFSPMFTVYGERSGKKRKIARETFKEVCDTMQAIWSRDAEKRAPFIYMEEVTEDPRLYTDYGSKVSVGSDIYTIKSGFLDSPVLIRIDSTGKEHTVSRFAYNVSELKYHDGKLYWSEEIADPRWSMKSDSKVRYMDLQGRRKKSLTDRKQLLFNPSFSDGKMATAQYFPSGGSALNIDGETIMAPDSLQIVETAWIGDTVYSTAISDNGFGIYSYDGSWNMILAPQPVKVTCFNSVDDQLTFISDRTGTNELYHLDPLTEGLIQKTSTRYGINDYAYSEDGRHIYFSSQTLDGMKMFRTPVDSLFCKPARYSDIYKYVIADKMAEQEKELAGEQKAVDDDIEVKMTEPKRYRKAAHMFNIHSWAPVYVNVDNIMNMSYDYIFQAASLGASAIMQNRLATGVGEFGYSAHKDPYDRSKWRHSGHFKFTYSGLYPVIEAKIDFNDRGARQYNVYAVRSCQGTSIGMYANELSSPYFEGKISTYIPFNFSSGGWYKGVIPRLSYRITNDMFDTSISVLEDNGFGNYPGNPPFVGVIDGKNRFRHYLSGSLRAYTTLATPNSAVYPRWGIGAEIGAMGSFESAEILSPMGYGYIYGYIPGFTREQGLKLSVMHQQKLDGKAIFGQPYVQVMPRGLESYPDLLSYLSVANPSITRFSADYAIPIYIGELSIAGGLVYIKRLCLTPHADYTRAGNTDLFSVGSALTLDLNGIIWIDWPVSIGATYSYSGIGDYNLIKLQTGTDMKPHHFGFIFNVSF